MTRLKRLSELFRAISTADLESAKTVASALCEDEEKIGHRMAARALRGALSSGDNEQTRKQFRAPAITSSNGRILTTALVRLREPKNLAGIVLTPSVRAELASVILEWRHASALHKRGISPRSKLLFHGPPGCGKSLTAQALGNELGLPIYMVRFDAIIGAFLGQTAIQLRALFHFAETTPSVILLDELDALGKKRGNPLDVGELDRIVISLLQELEHSKPLGVIVGTTNLPKHLDDALWRRFDLDVRFERPTPATLQMFARNLAERWKILLSAAVIRRAMRADSFASAERLVIAEIRRQVLQTYQAQGRGEST